MDRRIKRDDEVVLVAGRLSHEKNLDTLVMALRELSRVRSRMKVVFCGDGPLARALEKQVGDAGLAERVVYKYIYQYRLLAKAFQGAGGRLVVGRASECRPRSDGR